MKCISLWQPWASLMMTPLKRNETRSKPISHRGLLAIHAALHWTSDLEKMCFGEPFFSALKSAGFDPSEERFGLPFGAIVGFVSVSGCIRSKGTDGERAILYDGDVVEGAELDFGDYSARRYIWKTVDPQRLATPIPWKGSQGFFEIPDHVIRSAAMITTGGAS